MIANHDGRTMEYAIKDELQRSQDFDMSVAFVSQGALQVLKQYFLDFADNNDHQAGRIITSTFNYFNSPKAFRELLKLQRETGIQVQVWQPERSSRNDDDATAAYPYHPKGYVFHHAQGDEPLYSTYVGSSNLTINALNSNREWNLKVATTDTSGLAEQLSEEIESQISESKPLTDAWLKLYEEDFKKYALQRPNRKPIEKTSQSQTIQPNAMQVEALMNLAQLRKQGESRAIIVSATGTGKTYLSAFDVRQVKPNRMLYIAQQEQILKKAEESFQKCLDARKANSACFRVAARNRIANTCSPPCRRCRVRKRLHNSTQTSSITFSSTKCIMRPPNRINASSTISSRISCSA